MIARLRIINKLQYGEQEIYISGKIQRLFENNLSEFFVLFHSFPFCFKFPGEKINHLDLLTILGCIFHLFFSSSWLFLKATGIKNSNLETFIIFLIKYSA